MSEIGCKKILSFHQSQYFETKYRRLFKDDDLLWLLDEIKEYFRKELKLTVKDNWQVFSTFVRGVDFVGYRTFLNYKLLRKSTCKQMKNKMTKLQRKCIDNNQMMNYSEWCSINSYKGWLIHCDSFRLSQKYIELLEPYAKAYYEQQIKKGGKAA